MLLTSDRILQRYDLTKATRVYVDDGLARVAATVAQIHKFEKVDKPVWRPAANTSHAKTASEMNYRKVQEKSLAVLTGIHSNKTSLWHQIYSSCRP